MNTAQLDQLDIFGFSQPPVAQPPAPQPKKQNSRSNIQTNEAQQESDSLKFDLTGWFSSKENLKKLNQYMAALAPGDTWKNSNGVWCRYLGRTITNHLLHQDAIGLHIYIRHAEIDQASPQKSYMPRKGSGDDLFTINPNADHSSQPNYATQAQAAL